MMTSPGFTARGLISSTMLCRSATLRGARSEIFFSAPRMSRRSSRLRTLSQPFSSSMTSFASSDPTVTSAGSFSSVSISADTPNAPSMASDGLAAPSFSRNTCPWFRRYSLCDMVPILHSRSPRVSVSHVKSAASSSSSLSLTSLTAGTCLRRRLQMMWRSSCLEIMCEKRLKSSVCTASSVRAVSASMLSRSVSSYIATRSASGLPQPRTRFFPALSTSRASPLATKYTESGTSPILCSCCPAFTSFTLSFSATSVRSFSVRPEKRGTSRRYLTVVLAWLFFTTREVNAPRSSAHSLLVVVALTVAARGEP
mmetsp:Transcript_22723/g.77303  ORF Transcript_22723/g.77303 Transcript_22723/m.77303 type:complete len:312 (+) Transcript_22723:1352-2287(+)